MKKMIKVASALMAAFSCSTVFALTEINLPADKQVHTLNVDVDDSVIVYLNNNAHLEGFIKTDYDITFSVNENVTKPVSLTLNPNFDITGREGKTVNNLTIENIADTYFNTPIKLDGTLNLLNAQGANIEIYRNMDVFHVYRFLPPGEGLGDTRIFIAGGVTVSATSWSTDINQGAFFLSGGAKINVENYFKVRASDQLTLFGEVSSGIAIVDGLGTAQVVLNKLTVTNMSEFTGGFAFPAVYINGDNVNIHQDIISTAREFSVRGNQINLYGVTLKAGTLWGGTMRIGPLFSGQNSDFNTYGGSLVAQHVVVESRHNNFGLDIEADSVVYTSSN